MAVKWGSTTCTVIKWGSTTCTAVYWGSTKVWPDTITFYVDCIWSSSITCRLTYTTSPNQSWATLCSDDNQAHSVAAVGRGIKFSSYQLIKGSASTNFNTWINNGLNNTGNCGGWIYIYRYTTGSTGLPTVSSGYRMRDDNNTSGSTRSKDEVPTNGKLYYAS